MDSKGRSSTRNGANEVPRKGKAAVRRLKVRGEDVKMLEVKKKGRLKVRGDDVKMLEVKKKGVKEVRNRESDDRDVYDGNVRKKWSKTTGGSKQNLRLKGGDERFEAVLNGNSSRKRKRIYADSGAGFGRSYDRKAKKQDGKSESVDEKRVLRSFFNKERKVMRGNDGESGAGFGRSYDRKAKKQDGKSESVDEKRVLRSFFNKERKVIRGNDGESGAGFGRSYDRKAKKQDGKSESVDEKRVLGSFFNKERKVIRGNDGEFEKTSLPGRRKFNSCQSLDHKFSRGRIRSADMENDTQNNDFRNRTLKKRDKKAVLLTEKTCLTQRKHADDSENRPYKKRVQDRKSLAPDADLKDEFPKKKKRGIRLDPHDTSNKRLNDDIDNSCNSDEKKELTENGGSEISVNAKFRAICPSPSITSFVEDNLLGRRREIVFRRSGYNIELSAPLDNIPFSTSSERERIEVPVFRNKLEFYAAAKISSSFPPPEFPEIAFAGRSNVGKSSLLNALTRQWGVVRTSDKPGLTQTINFFKLGPKLSLVDLPGYGFAYAKDEVKEAWEELVKEYVSSRACLKRVCLLIDTKWGMKPRDHELIDLMERSQTKYQIVLTKTDLVLPITVARRAMEIEESLKAKKSAVQPLMMISSRTGAGIRSLRTVLGSIARFVKH